MPTIRSKQEMYALLRRGSLGHTLPSAESMDEAQALLAGHPGNAWAVRSKEAGGPCQFGLQEEASLALAASLKAGSWNVSPMLKDPERRCYGHLYDSPFGWRLHFSEARKACRLVEGEDGCPQRWLCGIAARMYLQQIMDQQGWDTIDELVREYPGHVVEFTVMSSRMHAFGPSNTIIWEVRETSGAYEGGRWGGIKEVDWDEVDRERQKLKDAWAAVEARRAAEPTAPWED